MTQQKSLADHVRLKRGSMTLRQFAKILNCNASTVLRIEYGSRPRPALFNRIMKLLRIKKSDYQKYE